jgi:hypothetical protein
MQFKHVPAAGTLTRGFHWPTAIENTNFHWLRRRIASSKKWPHEKPSTKIAKLYLNHQKDKVTVCSSAII